MVFYIKSSIFVNVRKIVKLFLAHFAKFYNIKLIYLNSDILLSSYYYFLSYSQSISHAIKLFLCFFLIFMLHCIFINVFGSIYMYVLYTHIYIYMNVVTAL